MSNRQYVINQERLEQPKPGQDYFESLGAASQLAQFIESRMAIENGAPCCAELPEGVDRNLRPQLPAVGQAALMVYMQRKSGAKLSPHLYNPCRCQPQLGRDGGPRRP